MSEQLSEDQRRVTDILRFAAVAAKIVTQGREVFLSPEGEILRYAAHTVVVNVAAAAERLSESFIQDHPDVPWREIRAMRNRLAHDYEGVNETFVWNTLASDLPRLAEAILVKH